MKLVFHSKKILLPKVEQELLSMDFAAGYLKFGLVELVFDEDKSSMVVHKIPLRFQDITVKEIKPFKRLNWRWFRYELKIKINEKKHYKATWLTADLVQIALRTANIKLFRRVKKFLKERGFKTFLYRIVL